MSENKQDFNRRDFISSAGGSVAAMAAMMQALEARRTVKAKIPCAAPTIPRRL